MILYMTNLFNMFGNSADDGSSLFATSISLIVTLVLVLGFKAFVIKSQQSFKTQFEKDGYIFDKQFFFPTGVIDIDTSKRKLVVSSHGKMLLDMDDIKSINVVKNTFEIFYVYIKTSKRVFKYAVAGKKRATKEEIEMMKNVVYGNVEEIKKIVFRIHADNELDTETNNENNPNDLTSDKKQ